MLFIHTSKGKNFWNPATQINTGMVKKYLQKLHEEFN